MARFGRDAAYHLACLSRCLGTGHFRPDPFGQRVIYDPKPRLISAPSVRHRVLHQAVVAELDPWFTQGCIHDNYACRLSKGPAAPCSAASGGG